MSIRRTALVVLLGFALVAVPTASGDAPACPSAGGGEVTVVVVVDFGELPDAPDTPSVVCVTVPEGATGADALDARARQLGTPPLRWDPSGLLCGIDGLPATGCAEETADGFLFWSYWLGGEEGWEFASVGPAFRSVDPSVTEGWHFTETTGGPDDPPPMAPSSSAEAADLAGDPAATATTVPASSDGSRTGVLLGVITIAGLLIAGFLVARRRRAG